MRRQARNFDIDFLSTLNNFGHWYFSNILRIKKVENVKRAFLNPDIRPHAPKEARSYFSKSQPFVFDAP